MEEHGYHCGFSHCERKTAVKTMKKKKQNVISRGITDSANVCKRGG